VASKSAPNKIVILYIIAAAILTVYTQR
jgi:hypothetical protein